jgi:hypothetical protein
VAPGFPLRHIKTPIKSHFFSSVFVGSVKDGSESPTGLVPVGEEEVRKDVRHISHLLHPRRKGVGVVAGTGIKVEA